MTACEGVNMSSQALHSRNMQLYQLDLRLPTVQEKNKKTKKETKKRQRKEKVHFSFQQWHCILQKAQLNLQPEAPYNLLGCTSYLLELNHAPPPSVDGGRVTHVLRRCFAGTYKSNKKEESLCLWAPYAEQKPEQEQGQERRAWGSFSLSQQ